MHSDRHMRNRRKAGRRPKRVALLEVPGEIQGVRLSEEHQAKITAALSPLKERERQFVLAFWQCLIVAKAARMAGYANSTANVDSYKFLEKPRIANAMSVIREIVNTAKVISIQRRRELLSRAGEQILDADPADYIEGGKDGSWINFGKESPNRRVVRGIESTTREDGAVITKLRLASPAEGVACIKELNEMDGAYPSSKAARDFYEALKSSNGCILFNVDLKTNAPKPDVPRAEETRKAS